MLLDPVTGSLALNEEPALVVLSHVGDVLIFGSDSDIDKFIAIIR